MSIFPRQKRRRHLVQLQNTIAEVMKKMGMNFSEPIPNFGEDLGYLAVVVRCRDRIRLLHAPKCVVETVQRILRYSCILHVVEHVANVVLQLK